MRKQEKTKLEKRLTDWGRDYYIIKSMDELRASYDKSYDRLVGTIKSTTLLKYVCKWVEWEKFEGFYKEATKTILDECGDGMLKEVQIIGKARGLPKEGLSKKLAELVTDTYGSLDNYEAHGASLKDCSKKLYTRLDETKFSLIEKLTLKQACKMLIKELGKTGQSIIDASNEAKGMLNIDTTASSAAFIIGTAISGGSPEVGKAFAKYVKDKGY